jgi:hypothetical protein
MMITQIIYQHLKNEPWFTVLGMDEQWDFMNDFIKAVSLFHCVYQRTVVRSLAKAFARAEGYTVDP